MYGVINRKSKLENSASIIMTFVGILTSIIVASENDRLGASPREKIAGNKRDIQFVSVTSGLEKISVL
mgnify:CR=1 FL=1